MFEDLPAIAFKVRFIRKIEGLEVFRTILHVTLQMWREGHIGMAAALKCQFPLKMLFKK